MSQIGFQTVLTITALDYETFFWKQVFAEDRLMTVVIKANECLDQHRIRWVASIVLNINIIWNTEISFNRLFAFVVGQFDFHSVIDQAGEH